MAFKTAVLALATLGDVTQNRPNPACVALSKMAKASKAEIADSFANKLHQCIKALISETAHDSDSTVLA